MNARTQSEVLVEKGNVVIRVEKSRLDEWKAEKSRRGDVSTLTLETPKSVMEIYATPEHTIVGSARNVMEGVSILSEGSRFNTTGTVGVELVNDSDVAEMQEWMLAILNNPIGLIIPDGASNGYSELLYVDGLDNLAELPKTSEVPVVSEKDFQGFLQKGNGSLSDLGNAERLVALYGDILRWNKSFNWVIWDGKKWCIDSPYASLYAKNVARSIYVEASRIENNKDLSDKWSKWAHQSHASYRISAMLELAKSDLFADTKTFDDNHHLLLNVENGILDLETGELMPHDPRFYMTKIANVSYDPDAQCPEWEKFLEMVLPDEEVRRFVQRAFGITISGNSDARSIFFMHNGSGTGNNGKSTMVAVMLEMLGEYAKQTDVSILTASRGGITPYNEDLHNRRFVCTNEIDKDIRLSTTQVKNLTGNDRVSCNPKYRQSYDFPPTHTLWVFGNNRPVPVGGGDEAFWGRVKLIPFEVTIPAEIRKPMEQVLPMFRKEFSGILNWALEGLRQYLAGGLKEPEQVRMATQGYRAEYDYFAQFVEEECELGEGHKTPKKLLFTAYNEFLRSNSASDQEISKKALAQKLAKIGVTVGGDGKGYYLGVRLLREEEMKRKQEAHDIMETHFKKIT